jgi:hypothetical protein
MKLHSAIVPGHNEMEMAAAIARSNIIVIADRVQSWAGPSKLTGTAPHLLQFLSL